MAEKSPTPQQHALGAALKRAREAKQLTLRALAAELGDDHGALGRYEKGERALKPEKVSQILGALGVNGEEYDAIMRLARDSEQALWAAVTLPEQQYQMDALLEFEDTATSIVTLHPLLIPGLLQTEDYVRAIMSAGLNTPPNEVRTRISVRLGRQRILTRPTPVTLVAYVGESALDQLIGSKTVMAGQLGHLLEMGARENVTIRVISKRAGWNPSLEGMFDFIDGPAMSIVALETRVAGLFLYQEKDLDAYRRAVGQVSEVAMSPTDSVGLIAEYITRWESDSGS